MSSKSKPVTIASAISLTGTIAVVGDPGTFDTRNNDRASLMVSWAKHADETLLTVEVQGSLDGTTWASVPVVVDASATITSGVAAAALGELRYTRSVTGAFHLPLDLHGVQKIRVRAKSDTGGSRGTITVVAVGEVG